MKKIYKIMGIFASMNESLSRQSINFLPLNIALALVAGFAAFLFGIFFLASVGEIATSRNVSLQDVLDRKIKVDEFIVLKGIVEPKFGVRFMKADEETGELSLERVFAPMIHEKSGRGIYVQVEDTKPEDRKRSEMTIRGKLVTSRIDDHKTPSMPTPKNVRMEKLLMIEEAGTIQWIIISGLVLFGAGSVFLLLVITSMKKYTIFRVESEDPESVTPPAGDKEFKLEVTGHFHLDGKMRKRFVFMPAVMAKLETGETGFFANIDASDTFMGFTTKDRKGIWDIIVSPDALEKTQRGTMYYGFKERPSIRIFYTDLQLQNPMKMTAVVSFCRTSEREAVLRELQPRRGMAGEFQ